MKILITLIFWAILLLICWPLALFVLILAPIIWLLSIPFRLLGITIEAFLALVKSILFLPARLLGHHHK